MKEQQLIDFIQLLRKQWYNLILIMGFNEDFVKEEECTFVQNDFHSLFMCSNTANFLWYLFFNKKEPHRTTSEHSEEILNNIDTNEINVWHFNLGFVFDDKEEYLPEHVWLILQIRNKWYIIQSFYCAYTINSEYGFFQIENIKEYFDMLKFINKFGRQTSFSNKEKQLLLKYGKLFDKYSCIDYARWGDKDHSLTKNGLSINKHSIQNIDTFIKNVKNRICSNISKLSTKNITSTKYNVFIYPVYHGVHLIKEDAINTEQFLNRISKLSGLESKYFNLINIHYITDPKCYIDENGDIFFIDLNFTIDVNIRNVICNDINISLDCDIKSC